MLELQTEALFFHFVVALRVELVEECLFLVGHWERFVKLGKDSQFQHLVAEVTTIELHTEDGLIQVLELCHREFLWQEFKSDRLEMDLTTEFAGSLSQYQIVVESQ